jgi:hypothetical protein
VRIDGSCTSRGCGGALTKYQLWGSYNLSNLEESDISFPLLQELVLEILVSSASPDNAAREAENIDRLLKRVAPNLEYFNVMDSSNFKLLWFRGRYNQPH